MYKRQALSVPGVIGIYTGSDLVASNIGDVPAATSINDRNGNPMLHAPVPVLAHERIRHVGEPVAIVVAKTVASAQDGANAVHLELSERPAAATVTAALATGAPIIYEDAPNNIALDWTDGDRSTIDATFASAAHVVEATITDTRLAPVSMEPRAGIGEWDQENGRYTLTAGTQGVNLVSRILAEHVFKVAPEDIRVITHDVGGGFGMKSQPYSEYAAILFAAKQTGRPVKWANTRLESFQADTAGRDGILEGSMAFDANGKLYDPGTGLAVQGNLANADGTFRSEVGDLTIPLDRESEATATTTIRISGNLDASGMGARLRPGARCNRLRSGGGAAGSGTLKGSSTILGSVVVSPRSILAL